MKRIPLTTAMSPQLRIQKGLLQILLFVMAVFGASCASIGPKTLPQDQFDYNAAISESSNEQVLMNLVRLRYNESLVFLKVSSVINQYSLASSVSAGAGLNTGIAGDNTANVGGRMVWSNRPTITYIPVSGQEFSRNLLTPLPPGSLFGLIQSGWPTDLVLRMTTWSINGIYNDISRLSGRREADQDLFELLDVWRRLREAGVLGIRQKPDKLKDNSVALFIHSSPPVETLNDINRFCKLLKLDPEKQEFKVKYGLIQEHPDEIVVLTGSIWEIMLNMAWQFDTPLEHIKNGRTAEPFRPAVREHEPPVQVLHSKEKPDNAFIAVNEQDYWFYIDKNDRQSKRVLSFLQLLLNLAEKSIPNQSPVITISQ